MFFHIITGHAQQHHHRHRHQTTSLGKGSKNQNGNSRWFEMDVTLGPNNLAMFKVISTTIYT